MDADVIVVGLGLIGSGAVRALADAGVAVVGVGPGEPAVRSSSDGPFASHYDSGRITRHLDATWEWAVLASRSIAGYAELERRSGIAFHRPVGVIVSELDADRVAAVAGVADALSVRAVRTAPGGRSPDERLRFPDGSTTFAEPGPAGHVDPRRMLRANTAIAASAGATLVDATVTSTTPSARGWRVATDDGAEFGAAKVLVSTGAHTDELGLDGCPEFAVRGESIVMATLAAAEVERLSGLPSVLAALDHPTYADLYLVPPTEYPDGTIRLKLGATLGDVRRLDDGAARRAWMRGDAHTDEFDELRALLLDLVPGLRAESWETASCLITDTASGLPVVDHLAPGLVVAAGGNGYAAKSANAIGALAARLLVDGTWSDPELDAQRFAAT